MNWKISLDKWLTTDPNESADGWHESLIDSFTDIFYDRHEDWFDSDLYQTWSNRLYKRSVDPKRAAMIIERAYKFYRIQ